jgi:hypothetical protein
MQSMSTTVMPNKVRFIVTTSDRVAASTLVTAPSYEARFLSSLDRACDALQLRSVALIVFKEYMEERSKVREIDSEAAAALRANYAEAQRRLRQRGIGFEVIETNLDDLGAFSKTIRAISWDQTALDISTMPRSYILTILRFASPDVETIIYTQGKNRREGEDAFTIGVRDIVTLPGFEGQMGHRPTLLVMSIGYEGARAYSLFRRYEPTVTLAFLGDPGGTDEEREQILDTVGRNNGPLLDTDGVRFCRLPSFDPSAFADQALKIIHTTTRDLEQSQGFPTDVVLSPVGTKPQSLGLFSIWREQPGYQIAYAIPTTRRLGTVDAGNTFWYSRRVG